MTQEFSSIQFIRRKKVEALTGLARATIYDRLNPRSPRYDRAFPRPIKIGKSAVGWIEAEVVQYLKDLVSKSRSEV